MRSENTGRKRGRPKLTDQLRNDYQRRVEIAAKRESVAAFKLMVKAMNDPNLDIKTRLEMAKEIMARGLGKPRQQTDVNLNLEGGEALIEAMTKGKERADKNKK